MNNANKWLIGMVGATTLAGAALWEGKRNDPYIPIPGDVLTVCYGETKVAMRHYTDGECLAMLKKRLPEYGDAVLKCINVPISENQHSAYTLWAYNIGVPKFCSSFALKVLNAGRAKESCHWLSTNLYTGKPQWSDAGGRYVQGLQNRRLYERDLCLRGVP